MQRNEEWWNRVLHGDIGLKKMDENDILVQSQTNVN